MTDSVNTSQTPKNTPTNQSPTFTSPNDNKITPLKKNIMNTITKNIGKSIVSGQFKIKSETPKNLSAQRNSKIGKLNTMPTTSITKNIFNKDSNEKRTSINKWNKRNSSRPSFDLNLVKNDSVNDRYSDTSSQQNSQRNFVKKDPENIVYFNFKSPGI